MSDSKPGVDFNELAKAHRLRSAAETQELVEYREAVVHDQAVDPPEAANRWVGTRPQSPKKR